MWSKMKRALGLGPKRSAVRRAPPTPDDSFAVGEEPVRLQTLLHLGEWYVEPLTPDESARIDGIAERVLEHFDAHKPEPSSFPSLATQVIDLVEQPEVDLRRLTQLIEQDPAIAARVLRAANSALLGRVEVQTVGDAIARLGLREVASIAVGLAGRSLFDMGARAEFELFKPRFTRIYHHSMTVGCSAAWCAHQRQGAPERAFLGGMFHDIGKSVALRSVSQLVLGGQLSVEALPAPILDELLERVHVRVGVAMHAVWSLPPWLGELCAQHHAAALPSEAPREFHIVRLTSGLNALRVDPSRLPAVEDAIRDAAWVLGLASADISAQAERVSDYAVRTTEVYDVPDIEPRKREAAQPVRAAG